MVFESSVIEPPVSYPEIFGEDAVGRIILGDPCLRDVLLQSWQLPLSQQTLLPVRIERIDLFNTLGATSSKRIVVAPSKTQKDREYQAEVAVTDEQGRILERMEGYWLRIMEEHPEHPTPEELANSNTENMGSSAKEIYRLDPNTHIARISHDGPEGQPVFEFSQLVSFHNSSALSRHVPLSKYAWWMGKMRETVLAAGVPHIAGKIATGKWGMVTNWTELRILGEITANDVVLMRFWGTRPKGSEFSYCCDFWKISGEKKERVAFSEQKATWVRLTGHGQVSVEPLPRDLKRFLEDLGQKTEGHGGLPEIDEPWSHLDLGPTLFEATSMPGASRPLYTYTVQTTLEDANQVGNVYFANYIAWQDRVRELFLFSVIPDYLRGTGENGEMVTLRNRVDHLREAMPFDTIAVVLYLRSVRTCGATFDFEYFQVMHDGSRLKLAIGYQEVAWMKRQNGQAVAAPLPDELRRSLFTERTQAVA